MRDAATVLEIIREPATRTSTLDVPDGNHGKHWRAGCHGKRARPVRRGADGKGPASAGTSLAAYPTARRVRTGGRWKRVCPNRYLASDLPVRCLHGYVSVCVALRL